MFGLQPPRYISTLPFATEAAEAYTASHVRLASVSGRELAALPSVVKCQELTSARRSKFGTYRYHSDGEMVEVRTPDGRHKITQRDGSSTTSLASLLLGELALQRVRGGWWRRRQRGGIEQNVSTCGNIEKVISLSPIHIIR